MTWKEAKLLRIILFIISCILFLVGLVLINNGQTEKSEKNTYSSNNQQTPPFSSIATPTPDDYDPNHIRIKITGLESKKDNFYYYINTTISVTNNTTGSLTYLQIRFNIVDKNGSKLGTITTEVGSSSGYSSLFLEPGSSAEFIASLKEDVSALEHSTMFVELYNNGFRNTNCSYEILNAIWSGGHTYKGTSISATDLPSPTLKPSPQPTPSVPTPAASPTYSTIAAGNYAIALKSDGTVVANGPYFYDGGDDKTVYGGPSAEKGWTDIVAVAACIDGFAGIKADGTIITSGLVGPFDFDSRNWTGIIDIALGDLVLVGLKTDNTVVVDYNQYNASYFSVDYSPIASWKDIVDVSACMSTVVGLKSDGTVVAAGKNDYGQCNVSGWSGIVAISAGDDYTVGLKSDGTVVAVGNNANGQCNVSGWNNIVAIASGSEYNEMGSLSGFTLGLKADGTVVVAGSNSYSQTISGWNNIVAIAAGNYSVGLKSDGTMVVAGAYNPTEIESWTGIRLP